ncbi:hypothetical protein [Streptomyces sp. SID13726]|uniref:hypothetical protein n=1 Tax=Streptomyces sp. SID13726 TaxID=2706058 RepID=UPI0013B754C2|nr:hypothetical protein [Streptomyces sp. SID13726]NEA99107.1 hypothetical protein [Streptomyces sp. SID13726]
MNVGHAVYGGVHFHAPATRFGYRNSAPQPARRTWHEAVERALTELAHACGRTAAAMTYLRPDEAGKEEA